MKSAGGAIRGGYVVTVAIQRKPCLLLLQRVDRGANAEAIGQSWSGFALPRRCRMATLDEIGKEKQRISEALARVDAQREKLSGQLSELEATERVLARYSQGGQAKRMTSRNKPTTATKAAAPAQSGRRRRTRTAKSVGGDRGSPSLGDQILAL